MKQVPSGDKNRLIILFIIIISILTSGIKLMAQEKTHMYRIAKIEVDPAQLTQYNIALKEQMTTAIHVEPGVLSYYAVADKKIPSHITIFEVYADSTAYKAHLQAAHFKKYKETVQHMVTALEVVDVDLVGIAKKPDM